MLWFIIRTALLLLHLYLFVEINAKHCIASLRKLFLYTLCVMIYSPDGLMRYNDSNAIVDDIPLLSQWIKKFDLSKQVKFFGWGIGIFPAQRAYRAASGLPTSAKTVRRTVFFRFAPSLFESLSQL